jgi:type III restriction enzyme
MYDSESVIKTRDSREIEAGLEIDEVFMTRHLLEIVPNPWVAGEMARDIIAALRENYDDKTIASNLVYIVEEMEKQVEAERDRLCETIFRRLIDEEILHFFIQEDTGYVLPKRIKVKENEKKLTRDTGDPIQLSLFDYEIESGMNEMEQKVAIYLDKQEKFLWWYRNLVKGDYYYVQGWKKNRIFPDFIVAKKGESDETTFDTIYVVEAKGTHLKNEDTKYKQSVFELCNKLGRKMSWVELGLEFGDKIEFQVIFGDEWEKSINEMAGS